MGKVAEKISCSVVIPVWNRHKELDACLRALACSTVTPHEIIVIDNGSAPPVRVSESVLLIRNETNLGFARACNQGFTASMGEAVLVLNQDAQLDSAYLQQCLTVLAAEEQVGAVTGVLFDPHTGDVDSSGIDANLLWLSPKNLTSIESGPVFGVSAAAAVYRRTALESVAVNGEYFLEIFGSYYEDVDLCFRLQHAHWRCWRQARATGLHKRQGANAYNRDIQLRAFANRYRLVLLSAPLWQLAVGAPWWGLLELIRLIRWTGSKPWLWQAPFTVIRDWLEIKALRNKVTGKGGLGKSWTRCS